MNGRAIVNILFGLIVVGVLVAIGGGIYQAGVAQGVVDAGHVPAGAVVPVAGYGWGWGFHGGFGFLGLLFPIFFFLLIFGLLRAAFWRGRGWGGRGYGGGYGRGFGPGHGPDGWREERDRQIADLHRKLHEDEGTSGGGSGSSGSAR